eukprot:5097061-Amphidinium_carterae.1
MSSIDITAHHCIQSSNHNVKTFWHRNNRSVASKAPEVVMCSKSYVLAAVVRERLQNEISV